MKIPVINVKLTTYAWLFAFVAGVVALVNMTGLKSTLVQFANQVAGTIAGATGGS
jgi:hypothetical protein